MSKNQVLLISVQQLYSKRSPSSYGISWDRAKRFARLTNPGKHPLRGVRLLTRAQDLIGHAEDPLGGALGDRLPFAPLLNVAPAELRAGKAQGLAAQKRDRLGFDFPHVARRDLGFGETLFIA